MTLPGSEVDPRWHVATLGAGRFPSPVRLSSIANDGIPDFVSDNVRVLDAIEFAPETSIDRSRSFEKAGPREMIYFDPGVTKAAIVTAGGLCPGINNVIRSLVLHLEHAYGVSGVVGFPYGFAGLDPASKLEPVVLTPANVAHIHARGGSFLGTSRGGHDVSVMLDKLVAQGIQCLFVVGGDGTMRGAHALAEHAASRAGVNLAVVGIPKTIDNDIPFVDKTFGFETAVAMAKIAIDAAHTEATSARHGIGLVKLMGRDAGFIAAHAALASHDVNVCLIPEVSFELDGDHGLLAYLEHRLSARGHAVVVVAEGCGSFLSANEHGAVARDLSGNLRFARPELDIGVHLRDRIEKHFAEKHVSISLKYIDPSYMLRGVPATATDAIFCDELARYAVHAAMAGKTDVMIGRWHRAFTHVPLKLALSGKKRVDPDKELWLSVIETTGQPRFVAKPQ